MVVTDPACFRTAGLYVLLNPVDAGPIDLRTREWESYAWSAYRVSNFFELAVAVAMTLFGPDSPAALATAVGALVEVPVMLSVCRIRNQSRGWYRRNASNVST